MSYRLKQVSNSEYGLIGLGSFLEAQKEAKVAAATARDDFMIINEDDDNVLAVAVYHQSDDIRLELSTSGLCDSPWI